MTTRRDFLRNSLAAGAACALSPSDLLAARRPGDPLRLLVLGGTGFLGPHIVESAMARGHQVTLFNRGKTRPQLFPDLEKLHGDRDPKKGEGLKALEGKSFDAVFDTSGYYPRMVRASAELLAPHVKHYVFISSISAYAENKTPDQDETAPVAKMPDPTVEEMGKGYEWYGALKALCEQAAEKAMPGRVSNVRPGYIVGPDDTSDRFTYWPVRFARGGEILCPGDGTDPIQIIDVRDLGAWLVKLVEDRSFGIFNACGPAKPILMKELVEVCMTVAGKDAAPVWVPVDFLTGQGVEPDGGFPIFAPGTGGTAGSHRYSNARAIKAGLTFRPVAETVKDTLAYWEKLPEARRAKPRAFLPADREAALLEAWKKSQAAK